MYAWVFRCLPELLWLRIITSLILVVTTACLLFLYVFPWIESETHLSEVTIQDV